MNEQPICDAVFADRYTLPGETTRDAVFERVARAVAQAEPIATRDEAARTFYRHLRHGALGAGRIMANAGSAEDRTMVNCFVHPIAASSTADPLVPDLGRALDEARLTLEMGGGVGYDFSDVAPAESGAAQAMRRTPAAPGEPAGAGVGVCAAIDRFDAMCAEVGRRGARRGAQMAVLRCDHPDLLAFVAAKRARLRWPTFNVSVAVTDAFMLAVADDLPWTLKHRAPPRGPARPTDRGVPRTDDGAYVYATLPAREIWHEIVTHARDFAEPGLLFIDAINAANPLRARERIVATNPCGEEPLPPYGACVLGPIDLSRLVRHPFGVDGEPRFDFAAFADRVRTQVRFLDDVLDVTRWPLPEHAREAYEKRRIGVGVTGFADMLTMMKLRYDTRAARELGARVAATMRHEAYAASAELAAERGAFPLCDSAAYLHALDTAPPLPAAVRAAIERHGLRNSHLLSFAPVGSVSLAFGANCSNGIEPAFGWLYHRRVRLGDGGTHSFRAENRAHRLFRRLCGDSAALPEYFACATDIAPRDHVAMLAMLQPHVDAGISKTVIVGQQCSLADVDALFFDAWRARLKGITVFRDVPLADVAPLRGEYTFDAHEQCANC